MVWASYISFSSRIVSIAPLPKRCPSVRGRLHENIVAVLAEKNADLIQRPGEVTYPALLADVPAAFTPTSRRRFIAIELANHRMSD
jgi:hypothetical protein